MCSHSVRILLSFADLQAPVAAPAYRPLRAPRVYWRQFQNIGNQKRRVHSTRGVVMKLKIALVAALCVLPVMLFFFSTKSSGQVVNVAKTKEQAIEDLVYGNRILYNEGVLDAFGHISVRDPTDPSHFYMSRGIAPSQVTTKDILQYDMQCNAIGAPPNTGYGERF